MLGEYFVLKRAVPDRAALAPGPASTEAHIAPQDEHGSDDQE